MRSAVPGGQCWPRSLLHLQVEGGPRAGAFCPSGDAQVWGVDPPGPLQPSPGRGAAPGARSRDLLAVSWGRVLHFWEGEDMSLP